jgi:hypothetical protein
LLCRTMDCFASLAKMVWTAPDGISVPDLAVLIRPDKGTVHDED